MTKFSASQQSQLAQIGAFLREHREKQSKSLEDIAIRTYIRPQLLSGIEMGDPDMLPEPIFVQGFIRRYAETLGLQGTEISQQFTVTSIPSTPRPARRIEDPDSSTTRLTRPSTTSRPSQVAAPQPAEKTAETASVPMFNAGSLSPLGEPFPNNAIENTPDTVALQQSQPAEVPPVIDDAVADLPTVIPGVDGGVVDAGVDAGAIAPPSLNADTVELEAPALEDVTLDLPTADTSSDVASNASAFDQAILDTTPSAASTETSLETSLEVPLETSLEVPLETSLEVPLETSLEVPQTNSEFNAQLPAAFTTEVTTTAPATTAARTSPSDELIGVEIANEGPNLKPFAIGAVVIAALTAGMVLLANVLGGDRPSVADNPTPDIEQVEEPVSVEPALPPTPPPTPALSDEPVYVEATATSEAWVSIIADSSDISDGTLIFEGTLQPGDTQIWEAQENLSIYSGDAGALQLAANGGEPEVMGDRGQPQEATFTAP